MAELSVQDSELLNFAVMLLDCVACGVLVFSPTGQVLAMNAAAERLTGLRATELVGSPGSLIPPPLQAILEETLTHRRDVAGRNVRWSGDGEDSLRVSTKISGNGTNTLSILMEIEDVQQAQEIAASLEHLDRLANVGILAAGMAHEVKNALVAVRTFVDLLRERQQDDELSGLAAQEVLRIDTIIKQVLKGAARDDFAVAPVSVHTLLNESVRLLRYQFQARGIHLDLRLEASVDQVRGDERQLRHAYLNLLINALEAAGKSAAVTVTTDEVEKDGKRFIRTNFADTGPGIEPEHLSRIFDPFFTTKKDGTGLGLAITRRIIQTHRGSIVVDSKMKGGTRFELLLPLS